VTTSCVTCALWVIQSGQLSLPSSRVGKWVVIHTTIDYRRSPSKGRPGLRVAVWLQFKVRGLGLSPRPIGCTPALSVTLKRRSSCGVRLVALCKCYMPLRLPTDTFMSLSFAFSLESLLISAQIAQLSSPSCRVRISLCSRRLKTQRTRPGHLDVWPLTVLSICTLVACDFPVSLRLLEPFSSRRRHGRGTDSIDREYSPISRTYGHNEAAT